MLTGRCSVHPPQLFSVITVSFDSHREGMLPVRELQISLFLGGFFFFFWIDVSFCDILI